MSFNIVDLVKDQVQGQLIGQMGNLLGNESSKAAGATDSMIPALLSGLMGASSTSNGAESLFQATQDQDDGLLDNLGSLLGGGQASSVIDNGNSLLSGLLGSGGLGKLAGALASFSGLSKGGTSSLMGMLAPVIIGILKRKVMGGGLNAGGLASMLMDQKSNIGSALPAGLGDQLNASGFLSSLTDSAGSAVSGAAGAAGSAVSGVAGAAGSAVSGAADAAGSAVSGAAGAATSAASGAAGAVGDAASDVASGGSSLFRWLLPLIGLAALAWLAMKFLGGGGIEDAANSAADAAKSATESASTAVSTATEGASDAAAALTGDLDVGAIGDNMTGLFGNATEALGGITDADSATAAIPALEGVGSKLTEVTGMFDKVPEAARGPLSAIAGDGLGKLQPIIDKVLALPGVGSILEPIIGPIVEALQGMAG